MEIYVKEAPELFLELTRIGIIEVFGGCSKGGYNHYQQKHKVICVTKR